VSSSLLAGLRELGYIDGRTVKIEYRWAKGKPQMLPEPDATRFAVLWNPADSAHALDLNATELAATELGQQRVDAAIVFNHSTISAARARIVELAADTRIAVMYEAAEWVDAGGLVSCGVTHAELFRRSKLYVDRILRGARPADLPIKQPTRLQLSVNRKSTRRPLGHQHFVDHVAAGRQGDRMKRRQILSGGFGACRRIV